MIITPDELHLVLTQPLNGLTSGCFDLLHFHHLHYLERCRAECGFLVVGVDSDALLRKNKGKDPVIPEYHRAAMVAALRCVDAVFILRTVDQFSELVKGPGFDFIFKNSPFIYGEPIAGLPPGDKRLVVVPDVEDTNSTTGIVEKIRGWQQAKILQLPKPNPVPVVPLVANPVTRLEDVLPKIDALGEGFDVTFTAFGSEHLQALRNRIKRVLATHRARGKYFSTETIEKTESGGRIKVTRVSPPRKVMPTAIMPTAVADAAMAESANRDAFLRQCLKVIDTMKKGESQGWEVRRRPLVVQAIKAVRNKHQDRAFTYTTKDPNNRGIVVVKRLR